MIKKEWLKKRGDDDEKEEDLEDVEAEAKNYVDKRFEQHTLVEQRAFNNLENLMKSYLDGQEKLIKSIDKRLDRLEHKQ